MFVPYFDYEMTSSPGRLPIFPPSPLHCGTKNRQVGNFGSEEYGAWLCLFYALFLHYVVW